MISMSSSSALLKRKLGNCDEADDMVNEVGLLADDEDDCLEAACELGME